jgi:hypothetical protein
MSIHTPITQENLDHARSLANAGRLADMYDYMASFGDRVEPAGMVAGLGAAYQGYSHPYDFIANWQSS